LKIKYSWFEYSSLKIKLELFRLDRAPRNSPTRDAKRCDPSLFFTPPGKYDPETRTFSSTPSFRFLQKMADSIWVNSCLVAQN